MRRVGVITLIVAATVGASTAGAGQRARPLLVGLSDNAVERVDPVTLQPVGKNVAIPFLWGATAPSPDRTEIAIASNNSGLLMIVDVRRMRVLGEVSLASAPSDVFWLAKRLLVARVSTEVTSRLVAIDPVIRRVRWHVTIGPGPAEIHPYGSSLVVLLAPPDHIGTPQVLEIGPRGTLRKVVLQNILAGTNWPDDPSTEIADTRWPGVAVDVAGGHAYVLGANEPIADVDLSDLQVSYHGGARVLSKGTRGQWRTAVAVGGGMIAVTGYDTSASIGKDGKETDTWTPAGLQLVDTGTWAWRSVAPSVASVVPAGGGLLAWGATVTAGSALGSGISVYGLDGVQRAHLFGSATVSQVTVMNGLAYAWAIGPQRIAVIDPVSGKVLATLKTQLIELLN